MQKVTELPMLRVGLIGSGFIAAFHLQSMVGVRNVSIGGVYSRSVERRRRIAEKARSLGLGQAHAFDSIEAMAMSGQIDALWLLTPNDTRLDIMRPARALVLARDADGHEQANGHYPRSQRPATKGRKSSDSSSPQFHRL